MKGFGRNAVCGTARLGRVPGRSGVARDEEHRQPRASAPQGLGHLAAAQARHDHVGDHQRRRACRLTSAARSASSPPPRPAPGSRPGAASAPSRCAPAWSSSTTRIDSGAAAPAPPARGRARRLDAAARGSGRQTGRWCPSPARSRRGSGRRPGARSRRRWPAPGPVPSPRGLVVKKGSKRWACTSARHAHRRCRAPGARPSPPAGVGRPGRPAAPPARRRGSRWSSAPPRAMASRALTARLRSTWSSWLGSQTTVAACARRVTRRSRSSPSTRRSSRSLARTASLRSSDLRGRPAACARRPGAGGSARGPARRRRAARRGPPDRRARRRRWPAGPSRRSSA